jgi:hypothetical protein
MSRRTYKP